MTQTSDHPPGDERRLVADPGGDPEAAAAAFVEHSPSPPASTVTPTPFPSSDSPLHRAAAALEGCEELDAVASVYRRVAEPVVGTRSPLHGTLSGRWLGHALHPLLTDIPIGAWTTATLLDLFGGRAQQAAARRFLELGLLSAVPTALSGATDWLSATREEQRVGVVHAVVNGTAIACYTASLAARYRGRRLRGTLLGLVGMTVATVGGYLGGHLAAARDTALRASAASGSSGPDGGH